MDAPFDDASLEPEEQRRVTLYRLVLSVYVRVEAQGEGKQPPWEPADIRAWADKWSKAIAHDVRLFAAVMEEARRAGVADANNTYRQIDALDGEALDLAIEWAAGQAKKEREGLSDE